MKIDTTDQRQSKFIIGSLVITVFAICFAIAFGCGGYFRVKQDDYYLPNSSFSPNSIADSSGNKKIVAVAQRMEWDNLDTEIGKIEIVTEVLPDWQVVPLCITDELLEDYWVTIKVTGNYIPYDGWFIDLYQDRDDDKSDKEFIGRINLVRTIIQTGCCWTVYNITFDVVRDCIKVESNHFPIDIPAGWNLIKNVDCTPNLNKFVDIVFSTHWYGCGEPDQRFELILSQKIVFPESPNSRMEVI
ncbi:MAG: hypothetical protein ACXAC5_07895 [Promethearchaeota archaeon]|jgi:hypothetical protein